jgi:Mg-chelatase subunit ChlD
MEADPEILHGLVERVGAFHLTDRSMLAAQRSIASALATGTVTAAAARAYVAVASRYFEGFEREARGHLRDLDRRLVHANQVVFNLTAERSVAAKRIEAMAGVLEALAELGPAE